MHRYMHVYMCTPYKRLAVIPRNAADKHAMVAKKTDRLSTACSFVEETTNPVSWKTSKLLQLYIVVTGVLAYFGLNTDSVQLVRPLFLLAGDFLHFMVSFDYSFQGIDKERGPLGFRCRKKAI